MDAPLSIRALIVMLLYRMSSILPAAAFALPHSSSYARSSNRRVVGNILRNIPRNVPRNVLQMSTVRGTAPGSKFESWYQNTIQTLSSTETLIPLPMDDVFSSNVGNIGKSAVTFRAKAWESKSMRYIRLISFVGEGYDVFNFMALPRSGLDIPILGIDVVSLPRGSLAAIDFQPHTADRSVYETDRYTCLKELHEKFQTLLPSGGDLQEETQKFFSPFAIWTRIPGAATANNSATATNSSNSASSSSASSSSASSSSSSSSPSSGVSSSSGSSSNEDLMNTVGNAVNTYVRTYSTLISTTIPSTSITPISDSFLSEYLSYRTVKDPAKRLLVGAFGGEWTERVLREVMFPMGGEGQLSEIKGQGEIGGKGGEGVVSSDKNSDKKEEKKIEAATEKIEAVEAMSAIESKAVTEGVVRASSIPPVITFVTGNAKKRMEVEQILEAFKSPFRLISEKVDLPELQGEPPEIAVEKCRIAVEKLGCPVITEDTSLCFHALKGLPGPYIKWFLEKLGHEGLNNLLAAYPDKTAYAQCIVAYCEGPGKEIKTFVGRTEGHIVPAAFNPSDGPVFGWDPVFRPLGFEGTYAQIDKDVRTLVY